MDHASPDAATSAGAERPTDHMHGQLENAKAELERLERLLGDAVQQLLGSFGRAHEIASRLQGDASGALSAELRGALTALQFQDMASQLIHHSRKRVCSVADCLEAVGGGGTTNAIGWVDRACPVAQRAVDAGSVELF